MANDLAAVAGWEYRRWLSDMMSVRFVHEYEAQFVEDADVAKLMHVGTLVETSASATACAMLPRMKLPSKFASGVASAEDERLWPRDSGTGRQRAVRPLCEQHK